jgi:addiction module HigA family antidote
MPMRSRVKTTIDAPTSVLALKRPPTHPGEVLLEEYLKPAELTQVEAARRMGIPLNRLNEIIRGKRGVSADTALRLAKLLDTSAEIWLGLQNDWDLWHAAQALRKAGRGPGFIDTRIAPQVRRTRSRARACWPDRPET